MRRVSILMLVGEADPQAHAELAAFTTELQRLGWTEGQTVRIDYRWADGDVSRLQALAAQLVELRPDLVVAHGSAALAASRQTTQTLPIVFADVTDPVGQGFVESLARPGGNVTGFAMFEIGRPQIDEREQKKDPSVLGLSGRRKRHLQGLSCRFQVEPAELSAEEPARADLRALN